MKAACMLKQQKQCIDTVYYYRWTQYTKNLYSNVLVLTQQPSAV
jgi:hypothetical protein